MDNAADRQQLGAPMLPGSSPGTTTVQDGGGDRYDAVGSTSAHDMATRLLSGSLFGGATSPPRSPRDEADAAAGGAPPSRPASKLSGVTLAAVVYFSAAGGPFGVEPALKAAGNLYALVGFAAMPFLWALPEAAMTYELAVLYPCASGGVRWTEEAFGETWGLFMGYLGWVSGVTNNASFPVLFLSYVHSQYFSQRDAEMNAALHYGILVGITCALALVNYRGLEVVGKASALILFVSMAPFVLMVIIGIPQVDPQKWLQTPTTGNVEVFDDDSMTQKGWFPDISLAGIAFRPFINNLYWNFNGFDQAGHYSTVVTRKTLRHGIGGAFLIVSSAYLLPLLVATGATDLARDDWSAGSLARAGTAIGGGWLGHWIVAAAGITLCAQFLAEMAADSTQVQGMADRGQLPALLRHRSPYDTPTYAILLGLVVIMALLPLPFGIIVELANFAFCVSVTIEFLAFARLRIWKGDHTMLRRILYALMLVAPLLFNIAVLLLASYVTYIYGACLIVFGAILVIATRIDCANGSFR